MDHEFRGTIPKISAEAVARVSVTGMIKPIKPLANASSWAALKNVDFGEAKLASCASSLCRKLYQVEKALFPTFVNATTSYLKLLEQDFADLFRLYVSARSLVNDCAVGRRYQGCLHALREWIQEGKCQSQDPFCKALQTVKRRKDKIDHDIRRLGEAFNDLENEYLSDQGAATIASVDELPLRTQGGTLWTGELKMIGTEDAIKLILEEIEFDALRNFDLRRSIKQPKLAEYCRSALWSDDTQQSRFLDVYNSVSRERTSIATLRGRLADFTDDFRAWLGQVEFHLSEHKEKAQLVEEIYGGQIALLKMYQEDQAALMGG